MTFRTTEQRRNRHRSITNINAVLKKHELTGIRGLGYRLLRRRPLTATQSYHLNLHLGKLALRKFRKELNG